MYSAYKLEVFLHIINYLLFYYTNEKRNSKILQ